MLKEMAEKVECGCDHLTHFVILLDQMSDQQFTIIQNNTINRINIKDNAHCYVV